jgi:SAM-dependent methyltransferase
MRPETATALHRINLDFYQRHAGRFSETRSTPWPGWQRVAAQVEDRRDGEASRPSVLDLGCGNGRLARFLEQRWRGDVGYLGLDSSGALLDLAAAREWRADCRFLRHDLLLEGLPAELPGAPFDLIAAFGLMHHMPGAGNRRALLRGAARLLAPGGLLAVSFWQFGNRERFRRRVVGWEEYNRTAPEPIDISDLEPGDTLLAWGEESPGQRPLPVRYCCWTPPPEVDHLLAGLPLEAVSTFSADGSGNDLNHYRLLRAAREIR